MRYAGAAAAFEVIAPVPLRLFLIVAIALVLPAVLVPAHARAAMPGDVCGRIEEGARDFPGRLAYSLVDLDGGVTCGSRANEEFVTASLYKLFVLAAACQERERGTLSFSESLTIRPDEARDDPPELRAPRAAQVSVAEAPSTAEAGEATTAYARLDWTHACRGAARRPCSLCGASIATGAAGGLRGRR